MICKKIDECFFKNGYCNNKTNDCAVVLFNKLIVCKENNSAYILLNSKEEKVLKVCIDGKAIDDKNVLKCDYAIVYKRLKYEVIFIELKGHDFYHALDQISRMVEMYFDIFIKIHGRIICSSGTRFNLASNKAIQLKKLLFKKNGSLVVKNKEIHEDLALL